MSHDNDSRYSGNRRKVLKTMGTLASASLMAGCSGSDGNGGNGGDAGNGNDGGNMDGGDGGATTTESLQTFKNKAGVEVGSTFEVVKELAKDEDGVTLYAAIDREPMQNVINEFKSKYTDIDVTYVTGGSEDLVSRWDSEYKTGNVTAEMTNHSKIKQVLEEDQAMELSPDYLPVLGEIDEKFKDDDGYWIGFWLTPGALFYNTNKISEDDVSNWTDLVTNDKWSDQKIGWDPTPNMFLMTWLLETQGREFFENLHEQRPRFVDSHSDLARFTGAGEFPVSFTYTHKMADYGNDLPVDYFKWDPMPAFLSPLVFNNKAQNPNAGLVFLNYLTSKEGQKILGQNGYVPYHPEAEFAGYPGVYPSDKYDVATIDVEADTEKTRKMWKEVMGNLVS